MLRNRSKIIVVCALWGSGALAQINSAGSDDENRVKELTDAMQVAQMLLSDLSDAYECGYSDYDVSPLAWIERPTYLVTIVVDDDSCDELIPVLNRRGVKSNLAFVAEQKMPDMKPALAPVPRYRTLPIDDYTLIHEINPQVD